jgi:chromate transporter
MNESLVRLSLLFLQMSLLAFGGANTILPELQRQVVDVNHMMDAHTFAALFALAQAAPGPNMMVISLVGWHVAGVSGAVLTMVCAVTPSSVLTFLVARAWYRFRDAPWRKAIQKGLLPVTAGLLISSAALLIKATTGASLLIEATATHWPSVFLTMDWTLGVLTLAVTALLMTTKVNPMLVLGGAAALGAVGVAG